MISVCIATYNGENYIKEQLDSILSQLGNEDEIIISDDGSTDKTIEIVEAYKDERIKIFHHEPNKDYNEFSFYKISKNVENAMFNASGTLIFLADQDDIWEQNKVTVIESKIKDNLLLLHDCSLINQDGKTIEPSYFELNNSCSGIIKNLITCSYLGCCMAFDRKLLDKALPLPNEPVPHDLWLGLISDLEKSTVLINDKLVRYRRHQSNQSPSGGKSNAGFRYKIRYRLLVLKALIKRKHKIMRNYND